MKVWLIHLVQQWGDLSCGGSYVARVKELPVILEFTSFQDTIMFHKK